MKKLVIIVTNLLLIAVLATAVVGCGGKETAPTDLPDPSDRGSWSVVSPDGNSKAVVTMDGDGKLWYEVKRGDKTVVARSALGMTIEEDDFDFVSVQNVGSRRVRGEYENISGKSETVSYDCNETVLTLKAWKFYLEVTMRAYDDGYAFRYGIRAIDGGAGTVTVLSEDTQFALPEGSTVWAQPYVSNTPSRGEFFSYEEAYDRRSSANLSEQKISMPMLYKVRGTDVYSLITESELIGSGFYGSFLAEQDGMQGTGVLQTEHTPAGCADPDNVIAYPFESPWRVGITGTLKTVVESELVEKVYDDAEYWKPDDYDELTDEEKEIYTYDWVEPGVTAWNWLIYTGKKPQNDWTLQREYVNLAASMGWKYTILDGGWNSGLNEKTITDFCAYAHSKGVKVVAWCNALTDFGNGKESILRAKLDTFARYGIDGIKIDFFDGQNANNPKHQGEDIDTIKWYETIYRETAKRKMIVNCHGANKPTGERRVYPNVLNREGIRGNEMKNVGSSITVNQMFVRGPVGPSDFTPVVTPLSNGLTMAHQMALAVLYEAGTPSMADYSETYANPEINAFYKSIPARHDETVFLCGEPDGYYVAAIRSGDEWFVAGINAVVVSTATFDLSFLDDGEYDAQIYVSDAEDRNAIVKSSKTVSKASTETVEMVRNGGFVYHLKKKA